MIDPLDSKSLLPMNSKLLRRSRVVLPAFRLPCDLPSISHLALLAPPEAHEGSTESLPFATYSLFFQLGTPDSHTKPIADIPPAV
jgi:hypothetical protein